MNINILVVYSKINQRKTCWFVSGGWWSLLLLCLSSIAMAQPVVGTEQPSVSERRIEHLEPETGNNKLVELFFQLKRLQTEMEALRGEIEVLTHQTEGVKQRQKDIYVDLDTRIQKMELVTTHSSQKREILSEVPVDRGLDDPSLATSHGSTQPITDTAGLDANAPVMTEGISSAQERDLYQEAFNLLKSSQYDLAIQKFERYLQLLPQGQYAPNAQYWSGEARYVLKDFDGAIQDFTKVVKEYAGSAKVPDAYLKIGFSYQELDDIDAAKLYLERVVNDYSNTTAARLASRRLQRMKTQ